MYLAKTAVETFEHWEVLLEGEERVFYNRFGDSELLTMDHQRHRLRHKITESVEREMADTFTIDHPHYVRGIAAGYPKEEGMMSGLFAPHVCNEELVAILRKFGLKEGEQLDSAVMPHYMTVFHPKRFDAFLQRYVRPKKKMFVGCVEKRLVEKIYGPIAVYVKTPKRHASLQFESVWKEVKANLGDVELVLPAAGISSKIIAKRLWYMGVMVHCLDLGSIVDALEEKPVSRKWLRLKGHVINNVLRPESRRTDLGFKLSYCRKEILFNLRKGIRLLQGRA